MVKKMSFDVNVLSSKPVIKAAANMQNDGGGGNLGYMSQGRREHEEKREEINIFAKKPEIDTFSMSGKFVQPEDDNFDFMSWFTDIWVQVKRFFQNRV